MLKSSQILAPFNNNSIDFHIYKKKSAKKSIEKITFESAIDNSLNSDSFNDSSNDFDSIDEKILGLTVEKSNVTCESLLMADNGNINFNEKQYIIDCIIGEFSNYKIYNVHNELNHEFTFKQIFFKSNFQLCDCISLYNILKDNPCICTIYDFDISYENRCVSIILEKVKSIDEIEFDKNNLKQSLKQILEIIDNLSILNLKFESVVIQDFSFTNNGIKLMNFEHLIYPHTQIFRIPAMGQDIVSNSSDFCLFELIEKFCPEDHPILETLKKAQIVDIQNILKDSYFDEDMIELKSDDSLGIIKDSVNFLLNDISDSQSLENDSDLQQQEVDNLSQVSDCSILLQEIDTNPSPVDVITKSQEISPQIQEAKNHFNFPQIDFSFCLGILIMLTVSLILKGIHESNFGFGNAVEVFFGLRLFWILLISELFYIVFRMKSQKHKKYISKKICQCIIMLAVILFLINASLVFHLFLARISSYIPSFTLLITFCWILTSLTSIND